VAVASHADLAAMRLVAAADNGRLLAFPAGELKEMAKGVA
jgi:topoisomerase-4 subunit A